MPQEVKKKILSGTSFHDQTVYDNTILSSVIAVSTYLEDLIFPDEPDRVVMARNKFAFRRRFQTQRGVENSELQTNTLNMPFLNFGIKSDGIDVDTENNFRSHALAKAGFYVDGIGYKLRATPIRIKFEGTYFSTQESEVNYVLSKLRWQASEECLIAPAITINGYETYNYGSLEFNSIEYNGIYEESDFLEKNRIKTIGLDFALDTYLINFHDLASAVGADNTSVTGDTVQKGFWIPNKVLLSFSARHHLDDFDWTKPDMLFSADIDHENETVGKFVRVDT